MYVSIGQGDPSLFRGNLKQKRDKVIGNTYQNISISKRANVDKRVDEVLPVILMYLQPRQTRQKKIYFSSWRPYKNSPSASTFSRVGKEIY
jgi:hypothetical protein